MVAIGLTIALPALADTLLGFKPVSGKVPSGIAPKGGSVFYEVFGLYSFNRNELVMLGFGAFAVICLALLFRFTMIGLQMRAVVESPRMTELNGIPSGRMSATAWALSSLFAGLAGVLIAPKFTSLSSPEFFNIVVIAIAAAALGSLSSLPRALFGGLGLGIAIALFNTFIPKWSRTATWLKPIQSNLTPAIPFVVLFAVLIFVPSVRRAQQSADPLAGVDPPLSSQAVAAESATRVKTRRLIGLGLLIAVAAILLTRGDAAWIFLVTQAVTLAILYLSLTVITGYGGYISLCQGSFAAIGAFTMFQLADRYQVSVLVGMLIGAAIAAVVAALLALPLLRLNGIWIAIATLAFAYFFDSVMVKFSWVGGSQDGRNPALAVPRPLMGGWDFVNDKSFLALAIVVLIIVTTAVTLFGKSTTGRTLRAVRGSELASQSIGISVGRARVIVFAVSAFVAAIGGSMFAMGQEKVDYPKSFGPVGALFWLVLVVTFGVRHPAAALIGAAAATLMDKLFLQGELIGWITRNPDPFPDFFPIDTKWRLILFGLGTIQYAKHPEGVIEMSRAKAQAKRAKKALKKAPGAVVAAVG